MSAASEVAASGSRGDPRRARSLGFPRAFERVSSRIVLTVLVVLSAALPLAAVSPDLTARERIDRLELIQGQPLLVAFVGNDPADADQLETWLGRELDGIQLHGGDADWSDWTNSLGWLADVWSDQSRRVFWSVPLIPKTADLGPAASGAYDSHYADAARTLAKADPVGPIFVRTGWEFNGDWMTWSAIGREQDYIGAFRRFVTAFRDVSDRFVFEWCPNIGDHGMDPETAYPGDDYVDIIGMDFYYFPQWDDPSPQAAWQSMVSRPFGLAWHQDFARARAKPTAYSEWGVALDTAGPYVEKAMEWFRSHDVVYQSYWNSDADFAGKLSGGAMPETGSAFRESLSR